MPMANYSIKAKSKSAAKIIAKTQGGFEIIIDEPEEQGGTNDGPNPVEYVLSALAGCLNVVGHLVAQEMGFNLKDLEIEISGQLDPAKFMGQSDEARAGYQKIEVKMIADTDADQATLAKWLKTVEARCPVSDNLSKQTPVEIGLK
ncbi:MAG: OsmC family protein [Bacillota bacterium]